MSWAFDSSMGGRYSLIRELEWDYFSDEPFLDMHEMVFFSVCYSFGIFGLVDFGDLLIVLSSWGPCTSGIE